MPPNKVTLQITKASNNHHTSKIDSCNLHCKNILNYFPLAITDAWDRAMFLIIILLYHTLDYNTYCNVRISNYKRCEHQIKYLSSFVAFKCFGFSVFTHAASQEVSCSSACMGPFLSLMCDLKCVAVLIAFLSLYLNVFVCLKCHE